MHDLPTGTITLLFTDIEGSTQLLHQLGDSYGELLTSCRALLQSAFQGQRGHIVDTQGDAIFAVFVRASDALSAAVAAQRALASHAFRKGVAVHVRMGLHTGVPEKTAEGYVGLDVHRAARIMSAGHGGRCCSPRRPLPSWSRISRKTYICEISASIASRTWDAPCASSSW